MTTAYSRFLETLYSLTRFGEKMSLDGPHALHEALGRPLENYPSILVGGTNGKGSTCAFLERVIRDCGLKTGLFTSPHLNSFTERIRIDGRPIHSDWLVAESEKVLEWAHGHGNSFFEAAWALATRAFADAQVDIAIWEVGLGGRLDATNVADPVVSCITSIGLDHTQILGSTLDAIAREKSAIFRSDRPGLSGATGAGHVALETVAKGRFRQVAPLDSDVMVSLPGEHQRRNASLALAVAKELGLRPSTASLAAVSWPGRCELIDPFILDSAHNPHAMLALADWITGEGLQGLPVIFGAMEGKDHPSMASIIESFSDSITLVTPDYPRRIPAGDLKPAFSRPVHVVDDVQAALSMHRDKPQTLVCGSSFLIAEVRAYLLSLEYPECGLRTQAR
ncbi:MAG: bifunctional folylpolyglutamate synthase/dihydrofolate synthase [Myxococcales bacterium]|nr:bifunctional folylpolyglutamate synthase/dihydrofolate synthase [Myxococcales bacterium]